jgi:ribosomal protein S18 acetylase RimI-like enzyme
MNFEIRPFETNDFAGALALWKSTPGVGLSSADSFEGVARFLARNPGLSFVASDGQLVVATILCGHDGRRGLIHHLAVAESHRRRGIGRTLVLRSLAELRRDGVEKCHLIVFRHNVEGYAFWRSLGAEERTTLGLFSMAT